MQTSIQMGFFPLNQLYSTHLGLLWCLLRASTTCIAGLCFNVCIFRGRRQKERVNFPYQVLIHAIFIDGDIKFTCISMIHACAYENNLLVYGNLLTMQANTPGTCGARGGKFQLVKSSSSSEALSLFHMLSRRKERQEERCQNRSQHNGQQLRNAFGL